MSLFGGSAWTLDEVSGEYYLHLFAPNSLISITATRRCLMNRGYHALLA
jgi:hypothetical protein